MLDFNRKLEEYRSLVNAALEKYIPEKNEEKAVEAMRYSLFVGGKRIRPVIVFAFCELFGGDVKAALPFACAVEAVHTYSLIFDDLPCMDNDTLRRGKPTNHVVFGEATSLLAGMGLYARAFEIILSSDTLPFTAKTEGAKILLDASGLGGIVSGQMLDLENRAGMTESEVMNIHNLKTSAMLEASALLGCIAAGCERPQREIAREYAEKTGLAFQIRDDILDVCGDVNTLGKSIGKDKASNKTTFVDILGEKKAQQEVERLTDEAKRAIADIDGCEFLLALADLLAGREY